MGSPAPSLLPHTAMTSRSPLLASALLLALLAGLSRCSASPQFSSTGQFSSSAEGYNSVYDNSDYYNYNNYPGLYDRQDLDVSDLSLPVLATAFLAAFLASLVGSSLVTNVSRMLSLEFKVPEPLQIRAIPIASSGRSRTVDTALKAISELFSKYEDEDQQ